MSRKIEKAVYDRDGPAAIANRSSVKVFAVK